MEYLWGYWKDHELANFGPKNFGELSQHARQALRRMRRRPTLANAFGKQAERFGDVTILCDSQEAASGFTSVFCIASMPSKNA